MRIFKTKWMWVFLCMALLGAVALALPRNSGKAASPPPSAYSMDYSTTNLGGSSGGSGNYAVQDSIQIGAAGTSGSGGSFYHITNPMDSSEASPYTKAKPKAWTKY